MARYEKVAEAIRQETSSIIHDELNDPRLGFVTVTRVELTPDLRFAKIFFSVLGNDDDYARTRNALDSAAGFVRRLIAERINLRFAPAIAFREDRSSEYSVKIQQVLDGIKELSEPRASPVERAGVKKRKEGRGEPKKSRRLHKKK